MLLRLVCFFLFISGSVLSQNEFWIWTETGINARISKKWELNADWNNRFSDVAVQTTFGEFSARFKVTKWFRPSVDFRLIGNRDLNGNLLNTNRFNVNANFQHTQNRWDFSGRIRYQFTGSNLFYTNYEPEFDESIRCKIGVKYDINQFPFSPKFSVESFYNPSNGQFGRQFNKMRYFMGCSSDFKSNHQFEIGYLIDQRLNLPGKLNRHILTLGYTYKIDFRKKKDE